MERKMINALEEIKYLREMSDFEIDTRNKNRYRIIVKEDDGRTSYCFSTPIYNMRTRKLVNPKVMKNKDEYRVEGTNCTVVACKNQCVFESGKDVVKLIFENDIMSSDICFEATINGARFIVKGNHIKLLVDASNIYHMVHSSKGNFSIMKEKFKPLLAISTLYSVSEDGKYAPVKVNWDKAGEGIYSVELQAEFNADRIIFEANVYEVKLFQDTTVEERYPKDNNVYGAIGFIGNTEWFERQWLYIRPYFLNISELYSEYIDKVILHIPMFYKNTESIQVSTPMRRFCSFGSNWGNKMNITEKRCKFKFSERYLSVDVTDYFAPGSDHRLTANNGLIIKGSDILNEQVIVSTGDNYSAPMILEIKTKI